MIDQFRAILPRLRAEDAAMTGPPWSTPHFCDDTTSCDCRSVLSGSYAGAVCRVEIGNGLPVAHGGNDAPPLPEAKANGRGIAALRNRNARLLDLLEALMEERDMRLYGLEELGFSDKCYTAQERADAALRAFVEAEQGVSRG